MEFNATIPLNCIQAMSNGTVKLRLDIDASETYVLSPFLGLAGSMVKVTLEDITNKEETVLSNDGMDDPKETDRKVSLIKKFHVQIKAIAGKYPDVYTDANDAKFKYKSKRGIDHIKDCSVDELSEICTDLEGILNG